jgi:hypothetical protein
MTGVAETAPSDTVDETIRLNHYQQIRRLSVGLIQINPETMQRYDGVVGEAATDNIFS